MSKRNSKRNSKPKKRAAGKVGRPPAGTEDWKDTFLAAIQNGLHVKDAAGEANIHITLPYKERRQNDAFRAAWEQAEKIGTKAMEAEAARRAYHGTVRPVYQSGRLVGHIREYSDTLIMFLLKARRPKRYRDNAKLELTGKNGGPIQTTGPVDDEYLDSELASLIVAVCQAGGQTALAGALPPQGEAIEAPGGGELASVPPEAATGSVP